MFKAVFSDIDLVEQCIKAVSYDVLLTSDSLADLEQCAPELIEHLESCEWAVKATEIPSFKDRSSAER